LGFAGVAPPATLPIVPRNITLLAPIPVLDYSQAEWDSGWGLNGIIGQIATRAASNLDVLFISPPVQSLGWAYDLTFYGPLCEMQYSK